jgi:hypothetical protein
MRKKTIHMFIVVATLITWIGQKKSNTATACCRRFLWTDDPNFVQSNPNWSSSGKYIVFTCAKTPRPAKFQTPWPRVVNIGRMQRLRHHRQGFPVRPFQNSFQCRQRTVPQISLGSSTRIRKQSSKSISNSSAIDANLFSIGDKNNMSSPLRKLKITIVLTDCRIRALSQNQSLHAVDLLN